jgi:hypothetical protein
MSIPFNNHPTFGSQADVTLNENVLFDVLAFGVPLSVSVIVVETDPDELAVPEITAPLSDKPAGKELLAATAKLYGATPSCAVKVIDVETPCTTHCDAAVTKLGSGISRIDITDAAQISEFSAPPPVPATKPNLKVSASLRS